MGCQKHNKSLWLLLGIDYLFSGIIVSLIKTSHLLQNVLNLQTEEKPCESKYSTFHLFNDWIPDLPYCHMSHKFLVVVVIVSWLISLPSLQ